MKAEIICIGTELLVGDIVNTNSQYISKKLTDIGIDLYYQTTVGDNFERVKECLEIAFNRVDLVITTGGLGPTIDDITKEVVADYFNEDLEVVQKYYNEVVERYSNRGFDIAKGAKKEASILKNSELLENEVGLAPGFFYEKKNKKIIVLPGPPKEMTWMMDNQAIPLLEKYSDSILLMKTLEIKGVPEGKIDEELEKYFKMSNPTVAPYAKERCVHVRVAMKGLRENSEDIEKEIDKIVEEIIFENNLPKVKKLYHQNGNLAVEMPVKNGKVDGEVKSYYENGNIQSILYYKNGFLIYENGKPKGVRY